MDITVKQKEFVAKLKTYSDTFATAVENGNENIVAQEVNAFIHQHFQTKSHDAPMPHCRVIFLNDTLRIIIEGSFETFVGLLDLES